MANVDGDGGIALLGELREQLLSELVKLADKRKDVEARLEPLKKELKEVDVEVEATRRMLGLVEATEQQLAGQEQEEMQESGPAHSSAEAGEEVSVGGLQEDQSICL
jgi:chromosome segregation ATPase